MWTTPETCKGKMHEGQMCRWSCSGGDCEESNPFDQEHICDQHCSQELCVGESGCVWDSNEGDFGKCTEYSTFILKKARQVVEPDCETYTQAQCDGIVSHEGKVCLWSCG